LTKTAAVLSINQQQQQQQIAQQQQTIQQQFQQQQQFRMIYEKLSKLEASAGT